jgi:hypothetical protein
MATQPRSPIPLPSRWPRHVRSAAVHAIALARMVVTTARGSPCAGPCAPVRGRRGQHVELAVTYLAGRRHLPIVELKKAA